MILGKHSEWHKVITSIMSITKHNYDNLFVFMNSSLIIYNINMITLKTTVMVVIDIVQRLVGKIGVAYLFM